MWVGLVGLPETSQVLLCGLEAVPLSNVPRWPLARFCSSGQMQCAASPGLHGGLVVRLGHTGCPRLPCWCALLATRLPLGPAVPLLAVSFVPRSWLSWGPSPGFLTCSRYTVMISAGEGMKNGKVPAGCSPLVLFKPVSDQAVSCVSTFISCEWHQEAMSTTPFPLYFSLILTEK